MFRPRDSYDQRLLDARRHRPEPASCAGCTMCLAIASRSRASGRRRAALREHDPPRSSRPTARFPARDARKSTRSLRRRGMPDLMAPSSGDISTRWRDRPLGPVSAPGRPTETGALLMTMTGRSSRLRLCAPHRAGDPGPGADIAAGTRQLPRFRAADDGGGALARARGPFRLGLSLCAVARYRRGRRAAIMSAAARPMPGARSTCRAPAGSSSIRPTASSATAI